MGGRPGVTLAWRWGVCLAVGGLVALLPVPEGVTPAGWAVFAVFAATIVSFLTRPLPMAPMVLIAIVVLSVTRTLSLRTLLLGYGNSTVWLVVAAFLIAGTVKHTGLGRRIALLLVTHLGRTSLGLGYALCGAELVLGPFIPSNTARGGGVMAPIVRSVAHALDSHPGPTANRAGAYLVMVAAQANLVSAGMFLTAMAANPLVVGFASDSLGVTFTWGDWALGALVPGLVTMALLPFVLLKWMRPELARTGAAQAHAHEELEKLGSWTRNELVMAGVFVLLLGLWSTGSVHHVSAGLVAWIGVCVIFVLRADRWENARTNAEAWDALVWLGGLVALARALKDEGVVDWFVASVRANLTGVEGATVAILLAVVYFYSMYGFSMFTGHITAMAGAFLALGGALGAPPMLVVALIAYFSTLCGCTTNYSTAPVVIYSSMGYVEVPRWFRVGFLLSLVHLAVWLTLGLGWWKVLGWW